MVDYEQEEDLQGYADVRPEVLTVKVRHKTEEDDDEGGTEKKAGMFYFSDGTPDAKELDMVVMGFTENRVFWKDGYKEGATPYCFSPNGKVGVSQDASLNGMECHRCAYSKFGPNKQKPPCNNRVRIFAAEVREDEEDKFYPFILEMASSAVKLTKEWFSKIIFNSSYKPPHKWLVKLKLDRIKKPGNTYYTPLWPLPNSADCVELGEEDKTEVRKIRQEQLPIFQALISSTPTTSQDEVLNIASRALPTPEERAVYQKTEVVEEPPKKSFVTEEQVLQNDPFAVLRK